MTNCLRINGQTPTELMVGGKVAVRAYLGGTLVYERGGGTDVPYLDLSPKVIFLNEANGFRATVEVRSNTEWQAN